VNKVSYQLVILISGHSARFKEYGYELPKSLLYANGEIILNRIIRSFKSASEILIIMNQDQVNVFEQKFINLDKERKISISVIEAHHDGPSESILRAKESLDETLPIVVSYCDVGVEINDLEFVNSLNKFESSCVTITGFHPHNLRNPKFGYLRCDSDNIVLEIREKISFTNSPESEPASAGIYGFKSKSVLIDGILSQIKSGEKIGEEYYLSLAVQKIIDHGGKVIKYNINRFASWGTPEDLEDFNLYSKLQIKMLTDKLNSILGDTKIFLAGGMSSRLKSILPTPKQLLLFRDGITQLWTTSAGFVTDSQIIYFISSKEVISNLVIPENISLETIELSGKTKNPCETALYALSKLPLSLNSAITFIATDNFVSFDRTVSITSEEFEIIVWIARNYPIADIHPEQFSWVLLTNSGTIKEIRIKNRPIDDQHWYPLIGNFTFSNLEVAKELISKISMLHGSNGEVFIDEVVNLGLSSNLVIRGLIVDDYMSVGIPDEFKLFQYLNSGTYADI